MDRLSVVVVSPDPLARGGLAALVSGRAELALAGEGSPREAARLASANAGAVILVDVGAAGGGLAALADLPERNPIVALAVDSAGAAEALRAGARAVLLRDAPIDTVVAALTAAVRGLSVLDRVFAEAFLRIPEDSEGAAPLTAREREVLALLADGLANKAIAERLGISEHTAKFHVNAILGKLGAGSRAEAIVRAARMGLVLL